MKRHSFTQYSFFFLSLLFLFHPVSCFLPGVSSRTYQWGESLSAKVNSLSSVNTMEPMMFYDLPFCRPPAIIDAIESMGEILSGDRIENSLYEFSFGKNIDCKVVCRTELNQDESKSFSRAIRKRYRANLLLDNLPVAVPRIVQDLKNDVKKIRIPGFPIGELEESITGNLLATHLFNHLNFKVQYHTVGSDDYPEYQIVGFEVRPESIDHSVENLNHFSTKSCLNPINPQIIHGKFEKTPVYWTYSVVWEKSNVTWGSRWDAYLLSADSQIHWLSISNSCLIVLFLTGMVAMIMLKTIHADFRRYSDSDQGNDSQDEFGWKLVHADVLRPPQHAKFLAVCIGSGIQVFSMTVIILFLALFGLLSPANHGALPISILILFLLMGAVAGYYSAQYYRSFSGTEQNSFTLWLCILYPGFVFGIFFILNLFLYGSNSAGFIPMSTICSIMFLWFILSVPLIMCGSYLGYQHSTVDTSIRTNSIPRQIPSQVWYMRPMFSIMLGGVLPFAAVFIELYFIFSSLWLNQFYYIFGFLSIVFVILVITCAEMSIVLCYFHLCGENYHWHWRVFLSAGSSGVYLFLYSIFYFFTSLKIYRFVSIVLYFGYSFLMASAFALLTGCIGFISCEWFIRKIYGSIKLD